MEPVSITVSVLAITKLCLGVTKGLSDLREKYQNASLLIVSICSESAVVSVTLSQLQNLCSNPSGSLFQKFSTRPEIVNSFDIALTGCLQLYTCLNEETDTLRLESTDGNWHDPTWKQKAKYLWKEDTMAGLCQQIRGIQMALGTLLQCLQVEETAELKLLIQEQGTTLQQVAKDTSNLRKCYPASRVPQSVIGGSLRKASTFRGDHGSTIGDEKFSFDDQIVNSRAYRRVISSARHVHAMKRASGIFVGSQTSTLGEEDSRFDEKLRYQGDVYEKSTAYDQEKETLEMESLETKSPVDMSRDLCIQPKDFEAKRAGESWLDSTNGWAAIPLVHPEPLSRHHGNNSTSSRWPNFRNKVPATSVEGMETQYEAQLHADQAYHHISRRQRLDRNRDDFPIPPWSVTWQGRFKVPDVENLKPRLRERQDFQKIYWLLVNDWIYGSNLNLYRLCQNLYSKLQPSLQVKKDWGIVFQVYELLKVINKNHVEVTNTLMHSWTVGGPWTEFGFDWLARWTDIFPRYLQLFMQYPRIVRCYDSFGFEKDRYNKSFLEYLPESLDFLFDIWTHLPRLRNLSSGLQRDWLDSYIKDIEELTRTWRIVLKQNANSLDAVNQLQPGWLIKKEWEISAQRLLRQDYLLCQMKDSSYALWFHVFLFDSCMLFARASKDGLKYCNHNMLYGRDWFLRSQRSNSLIVYYALSAAKINLVGGGPQKFGTAVRKVEAKNGEKAEFHAINIHKSRYGKWDRFALMAVSTQRDLKGWEYAFNNVPHLRSLSIRWTASESGT